MAHPGAAFQALDEAAALAHAAVVLDQRGQPGGEALVQAGQFVGGPVLQLAQIQPDFQHGAVGPDAGAAQKVVRKISMSLNFAMGLGLKWVEGKRSDRMRRPFSRRPPSWLRVAVGASVIGRHGGGVTHRLGASTGPPRCRQEYDSKHNATSSSVDASGVLGLSETGGRRCAPNCLPRRNVQAALAVDLSTAAVRQRPGAHAPSVCRRRAPGASAWQAWPCSPDEALHLLDHGVLTLELHDAQQRLAAGGFTHARQAQAWAAAATAARRAAPGPAARGRWRRARRGHAARATRPLCRPTARNARPAPARGQPASTWCCCACGALPGPTKSSWRRVLR